MGFLVGILAFLSEYLDSALGMGYGTALAPLLLLIGHDPLAVIPAILISQLATDIAACIFHHNLRNVDLRLGSADFKVALPLALCSCVGVVIAALVALRIPRWFLTLYIGILIISMGILILFTANKTIRFSRFKILGISLLASFNKGVSGGGYGPLLMGGQVLSGVSAKNAVGITAFAEALTCLAGFLVYLIMGKTVDWRLTGLLTISASFAVPVAALTVKALSIERLRKYIGILITILGALTLLKITSK
ncbi:MAG: sulfite exporter TauE/SafE family protein [Candidatus Omnitrophota bacterium]